MSETQEIGRAYIELARERLKNRAGMIEHCVNQLSEDQVWWRPTESMNSVANILLHLSGNIRQWIISGVGGTPDTRDRPAEFAAREQLPKAELLQRFRQAIAESDAVLASFDPSSLLDRRRIQGSEQSILYAIWRPIEHLGGHAQEVIYISRFQLGEDYRFAYVPKTPEQGSPA
ncbi:DUF1572 family protein [Singulisphaera sp. PoT]|uniref:DUF1572 family protein n=1 Tax=Singulisphaera sp. PoT TaxID=3411797 RepID=UPI003BF59432